MPKCEICRKYDNKTEFKIWDEFDLFNLLGYIQCDRCIEKYNPSLAKKFYRKVREKERR